MSYIAANGQEITEAMIGSWCDAYERGEFPEGERTVGEVVMGRPPLSAEKTTTVTVKIPVGMKATLTKKAEERGTTMSAYVRSVLANDILAAKQLMAQADGIQNPRLKESAKRVALTVSAKTRDETITKARNAAFARIPIWAFFLPVTRRQQIVLGRIYSFQCTTNKDGSPAEYRMSLSTGASELGMTNRAEMQKDLQRLISLGFITKRSNGARKPATYLVDEVVCVTEARRNGWDG